MVFMRITVVQTRDGVMLTPAWAYKEREQQMPLKKGCEIAIETSVP